MRLKNLSRSSLRRRDKASAVQFLILDRVLMAALRAHIRSAAISVRARRLWNPIWRSSSCFTDCDGDDAIHLAGATDHRQTQSGGDGQNDIRIVGIRFRL